MTLIRWNPYSTFDDIDRRVAEQMRSLMSMMFVPITSDSTQSNLANLLAVNVTSDDNNIIVRTAVPGFKEDEVDVSVQGNLLTITAESKMPREENKDKNNGDKSKSSEQNNNQERWHVQEMRYGKFVRAIALPEEVVPDGADASLEDGILTIKLLKKQTSPLQKIAVKAKNLLQGEEATSEK